MLDRYTFPTPVPAYVTQAATALNAQHTDTRVFAIPGENDGGLPLRQHRRPHLARDS